MKKLTPGWIPLFALAIVWFALVIRLAEIERLPLHFDEGINVQFWQRSPAEVLTVSQETYDNDPPGHRFAMSVWMTLAGPSPFSIRVFSAFFGVLTAAAAYRLARSLSLPPVARIVAMTLLAVSPYAIEYAQQAKGYAMGAAMAAISWWCWIALTDGRAGAARRKRLVAFAGYVFSTALAISTHYYTIPLLAMQWFWYAGTRLCLARQQRRSMRELAIAAFQPAALRNLLAQVLACIPMGVWFWLMADSLVRSTARTSTTRLPESLPTLLNRILGEMSIGRHVDAASMTAGAVILMMACLAGGVLLWRFGSISPGRVSSGGENLRSRGAFWFGVSVLPLLIGTVVLQQRVTFFYPRFLLYAMPNVCMLAAGLALGQPAARLPVVMGYAASAGLAILFAAGGVSFYRSPIEAQYDFRPLVAAMRPFIQNGDAALEAYIWMEGMVISYAPETHARLTWYGDYYTTDTVDQVMIPIARNHRRVWSLNFQAEPESPERLSALWLRERAAQAQRFDSGATSVVLFDTTYLGSTVAPDDRTSRAVFDGRYSLTYIAITQTAVAGDTLPFVLTWSALEPAPDHWAIFVHLVNSDNQLAAQNDGDPINGLAPSFIWQSDAPLIDRRALLLPASLPSGTYALLVGMYNPAGGERLLTDSGADAARIGMIQVVK